MSVLLANSDDSPERESDYLDLFVQQRVQGVLISPLGDIVDRLERLKDRGIVTVLVDRRPEGRQFSSVSVDDVAGGFLAVTHLIEQGCRHIAFIGGPVSIKQVADRLLGAKQACAAHPEVHLEELLYDALGVHQGREAGRTIVQRPPSARPDGAFCANDLLAVGMLQSLTMLSSLRVPDDLRLVGYDDIDFAAATVVPLTSIRQPSLLIGKTAVELLVEQIGPDHHEPREVVFQPELIVRESSTESGVRGPLLSLSRGDPWRARSGGAPARTAGSPADPPGCRRALPRSAPAPRRCRAPSPRSDRPAPDAPRDRR